MGNISEVIVPIEHRIHAGIYTRVAKAKAGTLIAGCTHNLPGIAFLMKGTIKQVDGPHEYRVSSPEVIFTEPGSQRLAYAVTDCVYATTHKVNAKTVEEAEIEVFMELPQITRIQKSFSLLLEKLGITEEQIEKEMKSQPTIIADSSKYKLQESPIHGLGCFTAHEISKGSVIGFSVVDGNRTTTARYINHSDIPNAKFIDYNDNSVALIAIRDIPEDEEILVNYEERILLCQE